jgi:hypothetical protein
MEALPDLEARSFSSTIEREMQRQRLVMRAPGLFTPKVKRVLLLFLSAGLSLHCGSDEALDVDPRTPIEPDGGMNSGAAGSGPTSGTSAGGGGGNSLGGLNGASGEGPNLAGMPGGGASQAGAPLTAAGAGGNGDDDPTTEQLSFGPRITAQVVNAGDVAREYDHATYDDCRTRWVSDLYLASDERHTFLNDLLAWNLRFWGCQGEPVDNFALIYGTAPLSAGDASLLIEHYIAVATVELTLSPLEITEMRAALERLSRPLIADPSTEPSQPRCDAGSAGEGGAGGAGGTASEAAGQGGTP